jgi:hypothetical protein
MLFKSNFNFQIPFQNPKTSMIFLEMQIRIRIRILLSNRGPTRGKVITVIHKHSYKCLMNIRHLELSEKHLLPSSCTTQNDPTRVYFRAKMEQIFLLNYGVIFH